MDTVEISALFGLLSMDGMMHASYMNINDLYRTDSTGIEFFCIVITKNPISVFTLSFTI